MKAIELFEPAEDPEPIKIEYCFRCNINLSNTEWWCDNNHWNSGTITTRFASQMQEAICVGSSDAFVDHPLVNDDLSHGQRIVLEWGDGKEYLMCSNCQAEFLKLIGNFFGFPSRVAEIKQRKIQESQTKRIKKAEDFRQEYVKDPIGTEIRCKYKVT